MRLDGKRVVVVGRSSGIGLETARLALSLVASVTIAGRSRDRLSRAAATLKNVPDRLRTVVADMADGQSIQSLFSGESQVDHVFVPAGELLPESADLLASSLSPMYIAEISPAHMRGRFVSIHQATRRVGIAQR
jgi:NAD(P)-dependent dehydrogenase (short-subunit alcohol dehydrogenase family)